jgi:hypothetical protein
MTPNAPQLIVLQLVLGFSLQVCAVAQTTPREQLDRSAGFQTDAQLNKIREDNEEAQVREERRALDLRQRELLTRELLTKARAARTPPAEIEEKIVALRVMEAQLKEELGDNHPKRAADYFSPVESGCRAQNARRNGVRSEACSITYRDSAAG